MRRTRRVLIVTVPPVSTLDVFSPLEVFGDAKSLSERRSDLRNQYHLGRNGSGCSDSSRYDAQNGSDLGEYRGPVDMLLVAGFDGVSKVRYEPKFLSWLKDRWGAVDVLVRSVPARSF